VVRRLSRASTYPWTQSLLGTRRFKLEREVMTRLCTRASDLYVLIGHESALLLRSAVTAPIKNFFSLSLAPTRSSSYPFLYDTPSRQSSGTTLNCTSRLATGTSLNCHAQDSRPGPSTCTSLNCNFALTPHDMPSGLAGALSHLGHPSDDMPSGHLDSTSETLGYWPEDMPSGPPDYHSEHVSHLGHLGYLSLRPPRLS
jgi:hypothetical protein